MHSHVFAALTEFRDNALSCPSNEFKRVIKIKFHLLSAWNHDRRRDTLLAVAGELVTHPRMEHSIDFGRAGAHWRGFRLVPQQRDPREP